MKREKNVTILVCVIFFRVRLFGWKRLKPLAILKYHTQSISSIAYSTGNIIGIASREGKVSIWDVYKNN